MVVAIHWVLRGDAGARGSGAGVTHSGVEGLVRGEAATNGLELRRHALAEGLEGDDGDDGDQGEEQAVLDHAGPTLAVDVELGLDPGLQDVKVHVISPLI